MTTCLASTSRPSTVRPPRRRTRAARRLTLARQAGLSLVEVSIVAAILMLVAVFGIPSIRGYVIEHRVPRLAEEIQRFVARTQGQGWTMGPAPYASMSNVALARALQGSTLVSVQDGDTDAPILQHGLGQSGRITAVPVALPGGEAGSGYQLSFSDVHDAACPGLATVLQSLAAQVTLQGKGAAVTLKDDTKTPAVAFDGLKAMESCAPGDHNRFVFTFR
ncbi:pilus assembly FimT family protein [Bordetella genomosp. 1]|uniref:pilus assembly FimT family protein n=1 Tax=Bordetella genomosp. 1 TaxID=1395607 RepID=UPI0020CC5029|nr:prepilin-type cleavage/methylation domain-containing protein [Bordetella genomosp. 1]